MSEIQKVKKTDNKGMRDEWGARNHENQSGEKLVEGVGNFH